MNFIENAKYKYSKANVVEKLIAINVVIFILTYLFIAVAYLFGVPSDFLMEFFSFPQEPINLLYKPWSIVTYAFIHGGIWHILSNILILYFSGTYFITYFSPKKLLNFYFLGAFAGAIVYMLSYNLFPGLESMQSSFLVGASAAVMAILVGIAAHVPNLRVRLMILGSIKFWHIAAFFVVLDIVQIPIENTGGHLAHLGGALLGYIYASQLSKGNDIGKPFEDLVDWFADLFTKKPKSPLKTVHRKKNTRRNSNQAKGNDHQKQVDAILDKISKSGYDSLSKKEKDFLFHAGKEK